MLYPDPKSWAGTLFPVAVLRYRFVPTSLPGPFPNDFSEGIQPCTLYVLSALPSSVVGKSSLEGVHFRCPPPFPSALGLTSAALLDRSISQQNF